jgi:outer membrane immunogenic protein
MKTARITATVVGFLAISGSSAFAQALVTATTAASSTASGLVAGVHGGYNWQRDWFVFGLESDLQNGPFGTMSAATAAPPMTANTQAGVDWYGTFRGRLGFTTGPVLLYATGGLAYGDVNMTSGMTMPLLSLSSQTFAMRAGWVAGAGIEYMVKLNLIFNLAYQHVDLGSASLSGTMTGGGSTLTQTVASRAQFEVFTVGLSVLFSPDNASHPAWEGLYGGAHIGGAWGDATNATYFAQTPPPPSDFRLKRDIVLIGRLDDGLGLYRYRYVWSDTVFVGVMAQEVALIHPEAVVRAATDDYLRVDYSRLGLRLMTWPQWEIASRGERL